MTPAKDLARQLVEHTRWEWQDGMLAANGNRYGGYTHAGLDRWRALPSDIPDIDDPATHGVLLGRIYETFPGLSVDVTIARIIEDGEEAWALTVFVFGPDQEFSVGAPTSGAVHAEGLLAAWQFAADVLDEEAG